MPFKDILVHVDTSKHSAERLDVAITLARKHQAHLVALFVRAQPYVPQFVRAQYGPEVMEIQTRYAREAAAAARKLVEGKSQAAGLPVEWREAQGDVVEMVALHARYADITVLGQADPATDEAEMENQLTDHLILDAGRPVLVVPYAGKFPLVGDRVMVAWNASRESTRAVNDALPILQMARKVEVLVINPHGGSDGHGDIPGADLCLHLARHGVNAEAEHITAEDMDAGNLLLSRATDQEIDLLVMGAWGRSRLRELVLGGATRHMLRHMTIPVLMSH